MIQIVLVNMMLWELHYVIHHPLDGHQYSLHQKELQNLTYLKEQNNYNESIKNMI